MGQLQNYLALFLLFFVEIVKVTVADGGIKFPSRGYGVKREQPTSFDINGSLKHCFGWLTSVTDSSWQLTPPKRKKNSVVSVLCLLARGACFVCYLY